MLKFSYDEHNFLFIILSEEDGDSLDILGTTHIFVKKIKKKTLNRSKGPFTPNKNGSKSEKYQINSKRDPR